MQMVFLLLSLQVFAQNCASIRDNTQRLICIKSRNAQVRHANQSRSKIYSEGSTGHMGVSVQSEKRNSVANNQGLLDQYARSLSAKSPKSYRQTPLSKNAARSRQIANNRKMQRDRKALAVVQALRSAKANKAKAKAARDRVYTSKSSQTNVVRSSSHANRVSRQARRQPVPVRAKRYTDSADVQGVPSLQGVLAAEVADTEFIDVSGTVD
ncbi:MAG: hypothetical protein VYC40_04320 [Pseudomonadota bacterium]|nr:hypothetical protein [Pseudomonadota bacterium]